MSTVAPPLAATTTGPLHGLRVVDFSQLMQGPWCAEMLGDLSADVVKVERKEGELGRTSGAFMIGSNSAFFLAMNRNKRSITIDLKNPNGRAVAQKLIGSADILIENFRPGVMERLGLGYEELRKDNPRLIYASASGFGAIGPLSSKPGQDLLVQAMSGAMYLTGRTEDPPTPSGVFVADSHSASLLALAIVAALFDRTRSGEGQRVSVNLLNAMLHVQTQELVTFLNLGRLPERGPVAGHAYSEGPYGVYEVSDGFLAISSVSVSALAEVFDLPHLADEFPDKETLYNRRDRLAELIQPRLRDHPVQHWVDEFGVRDLWCAPVTNYSQVVAHPQVVANGMVQTVPHPEVEGLKLVGIPIYFSRTPGTIRRSPPLLGEHTEEILSELGYSASARAQLRLESAV
jgi:crotonobetainyl-CoA:carnitine CoA-transferase CaiB-like acyl-CoA transferase